ncbi:MAG: IS5 family transposase [Sandaracinus sp.]
MRGQREKQSSMLALMSPEEMVPKDHPVRRIKALADEALRELSPTFDAMYASEGRPSIPPETLLKSMLLIALYSVRSERQFCERLRYDLLFKWFLDMNMIDEPFDASSFSRNRDRLLEHEVAHRFLQAVVGSAKKARLMSADHFSVDGTLIEAWASMKSFRPKDEDDDDRGDGNGWGDFRGTKRSNDTHASKTDPEAKIMRKGKGREAKLSFTGNVLMENRHGLVVDLNVTEARGDAETSAAIDLANRALPTSNQITMGADKAYDTRGFVDAARFYGITPHVAQNEHARRRSAIDARTTRHEGYAVSQKIRRRIESIFGWMKTIGGFRRTRFRGVARTQLYAHVAAAAYNLLRMTKLLPA